MLFLIDKYIPLRIFKSNVKHKWLNSSTTLKLIKQKHKAWNTYKATHHHADFILYTKHRNAATASIRKAKSSFETNLANNVKNNPLLFWKYVRNNSKVWNDVLAVTNDTTSLWTHFFLVCLLMNHWKTFHL